MTYQSPYLNPFAVPQPMVQPIAPTQVVKVNGENGARAYQLGPNSSALLLDESGMMVWLVTSDGAGYKTVSPYDIAPHKTTPAPDYVSLESRIKRLEDMINGSTDSSAAERRIQNTSACSADDQPGQIVRKPSGNDKPTYSAEPANATGYATHSETWGRPD